MSLVVLTGSRGCPLSWTPPEHTTRMFRVAHRALPLTLVEALRRDISDVCEIVAIGGGTVMDAAKAWLHLQGKRAKLTLIPTTFGTGAEVTPFATVYAADGRKLSLMMPDPINVEVQYIPELLHSLPDAEVRAGLCDAFAHGFESLWARAATAESMMLAKKGLQMIEPLLLSAPNLLQYEHASALQKFGRLTGQAIAISKTTAAHALAYELTQRFNIPHGYAVAFFLPELHAACRQHQYKTPDLAFRLQLQADALGLRNDADVAEFLLHFVQRMIPSELRHHIQACLRLGRQQAPCPVRWSNFPLDYSMINPVRLSSSNSSVTPGTA